jgi:centromeric protein E
LTSLNSFISTKETTSNKKPFVVENPDGSVVVEGINKPLVATEEQIREKLERGDKLRSTAATNMNEHSSRSHALFRLKIESRRKDAPNDITISQLNLVDLAGSERAAQTGASGQTLKEGCHINKSLFMLGRVINELTTNASHVSYRDSALTRILSPALGGNARTAIICTLTEASGQETKSSLNFSASAKMIKNSVKINQVISKDTIISKQEMEIKRLRAECESMKGSSAERAGNNKENEEMQRQISVLQKMILNSTSLNGGSKEQSKAPVRRMTWHPNQKPAAAFKRQSSDARPPSSLTIVNDENEFQPASNFLDKLDEEEEMSKIRQLGVGQKRALCEISPNRANIHVDKKCNDVSKSSFAGNKRT